MKHKFLQAPFTKLPAAFAAATHELIVCPDPDIVVAENHMWVAGTMLTGGNFLRLGLFYSGGVARVFAAALPEDEFEKLIEQLERCKRK